MGFIALAGLACEMVVVMVVFLEEAIERARAEGRLEGLDDLRAAITEGAVDRVRPLVMTVATTFFGLLPAMAGAEAGARVMKRLAAPMVGGLISSLVLTLVLIPAIVLLWRSRAAPSTRSGSTRVQ